MDSIVISRTYSFSAAHRIEGHPKCGRLHGHNYSVTVAVACDAIDISKSGMVMDYGDLDKVVKPLIDLLDHRYLVSVENEKADDPYAKHARPGDAVFLGVRASTAEYLCIWFAQQLFDELPNGVRLYSISVRETEKSFCEVKL